MFPFLFICVDLLHKILMQTLNFVVLMGHDVEKDAGGL